MAKIRKRGNKLNSVEAYACVCLYALCPSCTCGCSCSCEYDRVQNNAHMGAWEPNGNAVWNTVDVSNGMTNNMQA